MSDELRELPIQVLMFIYAILLSELEASSVLGDGWVELFHESKEEPWNGKIRVWEGSSI